MTPTVKETTTKYLRQEIDAFQLDEDADPARCGRTILKHLQVVVLNNNVVDNDDNDNDGDDTQHETSLSNKKQKKALLEPVLMQYVDGVLATPATTSDSRETIDRLTELVAILTCSFDDDEGFIMSVLNRVQLFTTASSDKSRSQACVLLGRIVFYLHRNRSKADKKGNKKSETTQEQQQVHTKGEQWTMDCLLHIQDLLIPRLKDTHQTVRQSAIQAVGILLHSNTLEKKPDNESTLEDQSKVLPTSAFPSALEEVLWSMWHDPSVANRAEAVLAVPIVSLEEEEDGKTDDEDEDEEEEEYPRSTIDHIIARIRDVKEKVRVAAVQALHQNVDPRWMNEIHFCDVIQHGLTERCQATRESTIALICAKWMKAAKFDPVELVRMMQPTIIEDECEKTLKVVLEMARADDRSLIKELSDPELRSFVSNTQTSLVQLKDSTVVFDEYQLFFTRVACATAKDSPALTIAQKEALLAQTTPDIPTLCDIFKKHLVRLVESIEEEDEESEDQESFVCSQLLHLVKATGLQEEGSRRHFASVMATVVSSHQTPDTVAEMCVETMLGFDESSVGFLDTFLEIIKNLENSPSDGKVRLLNSFTVILENGPSSLSSHSLLPAMEKVVLETVNDSSSSDEEREISIHCLGQLGLFTSESTVLLEYKPILLKTAASKNESLQARGQAMLAMSDLALLFPGMLEPLEIEDASFLSLAELAGKMMMHRNRNFSSLVAEVTSKLLFAGRLCDSTLLARLLVLFFDPNKSSQDDEAELTEPGNPLRMQQLLSLFIPTFCIKSESGRAALLEALESALEMSLTLDSKKTKKRPLVFPMLKMVEYVCAVVLEGINVAAKITTTEGNDITCNAEAQTSQNGAPTTALMASLQVARFLTRNESSLTTTQLRSLSKFLGSYDVSPSDLATPHIRVFKECLEELEEVVADATSVRSIRAMAKAVSKLKTYEEEHDEEIEDDEDISDDETVSEESETEVLEETLVKASCDKENPGRSSFASKNKTGLSTRGSRKSSIGSQISSISVLESIGSPNA